MGGEERDSPPIPPIMPAHVLLSPKFPRMKALGSSVNSVRSRSYAEDTGAVEPVMLYDRGVGA